LSILETLKTLRATETHEALATKIGQRVRRLRDQLGLTQEALAHASKLTPKFLSQIENGRVNPSIGVLARLVEDGLQVSLSAFFSWDDEGDDAAVTKPRRKRRPT